jgi:hypothetical protein
MPPSGFSRDVLRSFEFESAAGFWSGFLRTDSVCSDYFDFCSLHLFIQKDLPCFRHSSTLKRKQKKNPAVFDFGVPNSLAETLEESR